MRLGGVLLAAGHSSRLGGPNKLLLSVDGEPLVRRTARTLLAAGVSPLWVVLGHEAGRVGAWLDGLPVATVLNPDHRQGQLGSVRVGLQSLPAAGLDGVLVCLSDLPLLAAQPLQAFLARFAQRGDAGAMVPVHEGQPGHPVVFETAVLPDLLTQADGPKGWLRANPRRVLRVPVSHPGFVTDLDTPADLAALRARADAPRIDPP